MEGRRGYRANAAGGRVPQYPSYLMSASDSLLPKPPIQIAAAREAIGSSDFFLVARTDARGISAKYGLEDAIKRANLYAEAGADATFVEAPRGEEELKIVGRETKVRSWGWSGRRVCVRLKVRGEIF